MNLRNLNYMINFYIINIEAEKRRKFTKKQGSQGMMPRLPYADYIKRIALS